MSEPRWLIILERPFRGDIERTYADSLNQARVCCAQFRGAVDVLVRGQAALLVRQQPSAPVPDKWWGHIPLEGIGPIISDGTPVFVEEESLTHIRTEDGLLDGVTPISRRNMAATWSTYEGILFF